MNHNKAVFLTCFVALLWSLAGLNIKLIDWPTYAIAGGRSLVAVLVMTPFLWSRRASYPKCSVLLKDRNFLCAALCFACFNYCFIASTKLTTSAIAIMMQYTAPVYVALFSYWFLHERITKLDIYVVGVVLLGMFMFFSDSSGHGTLVGNIVAVFNGVTFAGICIFLRLQHHGSPDLSMYCGNILASIIGIPFMVSAGRPDFRSFIFLLVAGILIAVTYELYALASKELSALETVILPIIDPVMNPVWVYLFLGEYPGTLSILACVMILASVTWSIIHKLHSDLPDSC